MTRITVELAPLMAKGGIAFVLGSAARLLPVENRPELADGSRQNDDYQRGLASAPHTSPGGTDVHEQT